MVKNVGVDISWRYVSYKLYYATQEGGGTLARGDYDIAAFPFNEGGVDPENDGLYKCATREPRGPNAAKYCDATMDLLQKQSLQELDPKVRREYVDRIERLAASEAPYIFLYYVPRRLLWNPALNRTHSNFLDLWHDVRDWHFR
jgi:ABC-type oligopeptide transport system substrate-binding subunit